VEWELVRGKVHSQQPAAAGKSAGCIIYIQVRGGTHSGSIKDIRLLNFQEAGLKVSVISSGRLTFKARVVGAGWKKTLTSSKSHSKISVASCE
jgi:hypothetical protein